MQLQNFSAIKTALSRKAEAKTVAVTVEDGEEAEGEAEVEREARIRMSPNQPEPDGEVRAAEVRAAEVRAAEMRAERGRNMGYEPDTELEAAPRRRTKVGPSLQALSEIRYPQI